MSLPADTAKENGAELMPE